MKKKPLLIGLLILIMLICAFFLSYYFFNYDELQKLNIKLSPKETSNIIGYYDEIIFGSNRMYYIKRDKKYYIVNSSDKILDTVPSNITDFRGFYDNYYEYRINNKVFVKRNGVLLKEYNLSNEDYLFNYEIMKDSNDDEAKYLLYSASDIINLSNNLVLTYFSNYQQSGKCVTLLFDTSTGVITNSFENKLKKVEFPFNKYIVLEENLKKDVEIEPAKMVDGELEDAITTPIYKYIFLSKEDGSIIHELESYIFGDDDSNYGFPVELYTNKYLKVAKDKKIGVLDVDFKEIIPFNYDDIILNPITNDAIVAKKDSKYGVIDKNNNIIMDFSFDYIEVTRDNLLCVTNGIMQIYNHKGTLVAEESFAVSDSDNPMSFKVYYENDSTIVNSLSKKCHIIIKNNKPTYNQEIYEYKPKKSLNSKYEYELVDNKIRIYFKNGLLGKEIDGEEIKYLSDSVYSVKTKHGYRFTELVI